MKQLILLLLLSPISSFCQDVPYYNRGVDKKQDIGAINQNFRDLADRKDLLSDGDVPPEYQKCLFSPMFCVNQYDNKIYIGEQGLTFNDGSTSSSFSDFVLKSGDTMTGNLYAPEIHANHVIFSTASFDRIFIGTTTDFYDEYGPHRFLVTGANNTNLFALQNESGDMRAAMYVKSNDAPIPFQWGTITDSKIGFFTKNQEPQFTLDPNGGVLIGKNVNGNHGDFFPPPNGMLVEGNIISSGIITGIDNVQTWGAWCDYYHDDTVALQAAFDYASSLSSTTYGHYQPVYIPPGNCLFTSQLHVPRGVKLKSDGQLVYDGPFTYDPIITFSSRTYIENLTLNAGGSSGIQMGEGETGSDSTIEKLFLTGLGVSSDSTHFNFGLKLMGWGFRIHDFESDQCHVNLWIKNAADIQMTNLIFVGGYNGALIDGSSQVLITNMDVDSPWGPGLQIDESNDIRVHGTIWMNGTSYPENTGYGVVLGSTTYGDGNTQGDITLDLNLLSAGTTNLYIANTQNADIKLFISTGPSYTTTFPTYVGIEYGTGLGDGINITETIPSGVIPYIGTKAGTLVINQDSKITTVVSTATYAVTTSSDTYWNLTSSSNSYWNSLYGLLNSTASALTAEIARAVAAENAHSVATSTHGAVAAATADRIVLRDATGSFAMQTASGTLYGNASSATYANTANYAVTTSSDAYWNAKVDRSGDTMTGQLTSQSSMTATYFVGDGSLLTNLPEQGSRIFYFSTAPADISGFYGMYSTPTVNAGTITLSGISLADVVIGTWTTLSGSILPGTIPYGVWDIEVYANQATTVGNKNVILYGKFYKRSAAGVLTLLGTSFNSANLTTTIAEYRLSFSAPTTSFDSGDRILAIGYYSVSGSGSNPTINIYFGGAYDAHINMPANAVSVYNYVPYAGATSLLNLGIYGVTTSSDIVANKFFGNGSSLTNLTTVTYIADGTSLNLSGATFSAKASSVTLQGNTFNGANQLVQMTAANKLPAVDGSLLTGLAAIGDHLGNHVATTTLQMGAYGINTSSNIMAAGVTVSSNISVANILYTANGNVGIGAVYPRAHLEVNTGLPAYIPLGTNTTDGMLIGDASTIYGRFGTANFFAGGGGYPTYLQAGQTDSELYYNVLLNPLGGYVGIGKTIPTTALDITGTVTATAFAGPLTGNVTGNADTATSVAASGVDLSTVTSALAGKQASGNYITALTGNVTASGPGSVAATIVTVPDGAVNLSTVTTALADKASLSLTNTFASSQTITGNGGQYGLQVSSGVSLAGLLYTNRGNVGIGTVAPQAKLELYSAGSTANMIQIDEPGYINYGMIFRMLNSPEYLQLNTLQNGVENTTTPSMTWNAINGNVGIGIAEPGNKLSITETRTANSYSTILRAASGGSSGGGARISLVGNDYGAFIESNGYVTTGQRSGSSAEDMNLATENGGGGSINFYTNDTRKVRFANNGDASFDTTTATTTFSGGVTINGDRTKLLNTTTGAALCLDSSGIIRVCSSVVDAGGNCDCVPPI